MIRTILFDLDGTLLPMDQEVFTTEYFRLLTQTAAARGYEAKKLCDTTWRGTAAMVKNDGQAWNKEIFWNVFLSVYGQEAAKDIHFFEDFYKNEFHGAAAVCGKNPLAAQTVKYARGRGFRVALATNPLFPAEGTRNRIRWAGLQPEDFELYTTYENSRYCKPNPNYYRDIADALGCRPEECLMVGNDAEEDMAAQKLGMQVFLLTDCLINSKKQDLLSYPKGDFNALLSYITALPALKDAGRRI